MEKPKVKLRNDEKDEHKEKIDLMIVNKCSTEEHN